jgi:hypothetical protein
MQFVRGLLNTVRMSVTLQYALLLSHRLTALCFMFFVLCYILINCFMFLNLFVLMFVFLSSMLCFLFCVFSLFVLFCILFLLLYIALSFLFLYQFADRCHRVETKLQLINVI